MQTPTALGTSAQPSQIGLGARFVEEDEPRGIEATLAPAPAAPCPDDVGAVLFAGAERFFL